MLIAVELASVSWYAGALSDLHRVVSRPLGCARRCVRQPQQSFRTLLLVSAGFTPIERGKQADLLLVRGDVAADIGSIAHPVLVVRAGIAYDPRKLVDATTGSVGRE